MIPQEEQELTPEQEKQFIKDFNAGYAMREFEPDITDKLLDENKSDSDYIKAFKAGSRQRKIDQLVEDKQITSQKIEQEHKRRPKM